MHEMNNNNNNTKTAKIQNNNKTNNNNNNNAANDDTFLNTLKNTGYFSSFVKHTHLKKHNILAKIFGAFILSCTLFGGFIFGELYDICLDDSVLYKKDPVFRKFSENLFIFTVLLIAIFLLQLSIWQPETSHNNNNNNKPQPKSSLIPKFLLNWVSIFEISFSVLWFSLTYFVCIIIKTILGDHNCAEHPNSVSGHYAFYIYYLFAMPYLFLKASSKEIIEDVSSKRKVVQEYGVKKVVLRKKKGLFDRTPSLLILITYVVFFVSSIVTLTRTWAYGFHTPRQIFYGSLLAVASHLTKVELIELASKLKDGYTYLLGILVVGWIIFAILVSYFASFPLSPFEIVLCLFLWIMSTLFVWRESKVKKE